MQTILARHNQNIINTVEKLKTMIGKTVVPAELSDYKDIVIQICDEVIKSANTNLIRIKLLPFVDIYEDLISETQQAVFRSRWLSSTLAPQILRATESDRLSLTIIGWLNKSHPETASCPPSLGSGGWGVIPYIGMPLYYLPIVEQRGLLYQPLLFHEFGHVLYKYHEKEILDIVRDLQYGILDSLLPTSQRNDAYEIRKSGERQSIAVTWYHWIQELFCDAVGFTIGGPCFLYAFSSYLENIHPGDFRSSPDDLRRSSHPIKWLRIRFLARRARDEGFASVADEIEIEWERVAKRLGIVEDYFGYYDRILDKLIYETIEDMLVEADPRHFEEDEVLETPLVNTSNNLVLYMNQAWNLFRNDPVKYDGWEARTITNILKSAQSSRAIP